MRLAVVALIGLGFAATAQAQQDTMSFFSRNGGRVRNRVNRPFECAALLGAAISQIVAL
jgi:hypothetical protein